MSEQTETVVEEAVSADATSAEATEAVQEAVEAVVVDKPEAQPAAPEIVAEVAAADTPETSSTTAAEPKASADDEMEDDGAGGKRVVRVLSVGQELEGVVKRIAEFGAFVDIGVGRDGLLHVSELSLQRVPKVSDVLKQGQTITVWIKELDRERNRISLTMVSPDTKTIRDLSEGEIVEGTVSRILPYGAFIDIGVGRDALLHVREMGEGFVKRPEDVVTLGETIEARIVSLSRRRQRIDLSLKGLRPEPEPEAPVAAAEEDEEIVDDPFENVEVLSPMELAFKRAMEGSDVEMVAQPAKRSGRRKNRRQQRAQFRTKLLPARWPTRHRNRFGKNLRHSAHEMLSCCEYVK
ncbi:MAG: S1 RNA-binding domain-containing protein [Caldilineaceae bacterium]